MVTSKERIVAIAELVAGYVNEHPRAADTPGGILRWWVGRYRTGDSLEDVQQALDRLVEQGRLSRVPLPDGAAIYSRAIPPPEQND